MTASFSQRKSHARRGAAVIDATIAEAIASIQAERKAEREAAIAEAAQHGPRVPLTREDCVGAKLIRTRTGWHQVAKVNAKSVSVFTGYSWVDRVPFDKVLEVRK